MEDTPDLNSVEEKKGRWMDGRGFVGVCALHPGRGPVSRLENLCKEVAWGDARLGRQSGPVWE